jgi:hypothetical protein
MQFMPQTPKLPTPPLFINADLNGDRTCADVKIHHMTLRSEAAAQPSNYLGHFLSSGIYNMSMFIWVISTVR